MRGIVLPIAFRRKLPFASASGRKDAELNAEPYRRSSAGRS